jgi:GMP synthase (glutamine-hydrolysing)
LYAVLTAIIFRLSLNPAIPLKSFVIIKTGSTLSPIRQRFGDFEDWMNAGCGLYGAPVIDVAGGEALPLPGTLVGAIITGSPAMVTDQSEWMQSLAVWVRQAVREEIPVLGVCFGHQLLAQAMGGHVDYHPEGREIGTVAIELTEEGKRDALLGHLPERFTAHVTHAQSVIRLPANAVRLAANTYEAHQAFRVGECAWGVQFHPEFSAAIMRGYVDEHAAALHEQGRDVAALKAAIADTEAANALLKRFYGYCAERWLRDGDAPKPVNPDSGR